MKRALTIIFVVFLGLTGFTRGQEQTSSDDYFHEVKSGETLTGIAVHELGSYSLYEKIARDNGLEKPYVIKPGQKLLISIPKTGEESVAEEAPVKAETARNRKASPNQPVYESYGNKMFGLVLALTLVIVFFAGVERRIRLRDKAIFIAFALIACASVNPTVVSTDSDLDLFGPGYNYIETTDGSYSVTLVPNDYHFQITERKGAYYDYDEREAELQKSLEKERILSSKFLRVLYAENAKAEVMPKWAWREKALALRRSLIPVSEREEICAGFEHYYRIRPQKYKAESYPEEILKACRARGIPPNLLDSLIAMESGGKADLISHKGAVGVMQIMPSTAKWHGIESAELFNYEKNIDFGSAYFAILYAMFGESLEKTLSAYNRGPGNVAREGVSENNRNEFVVPVLNESDRLLKRATTGVKGGELIVIDDPPHPDENLLYADPEKWSPII